jgi:hypothetical protein
VGDYQDAQEFLAQLYPGQYDDTMGRCRSRARDLFGTHFHHEHVAREVAEFLRARLAEQPESPERDAVLSVVNACESAATYMSSGTKAINLALASLLRLALPYDGHADYQEKWQPKEADGG